MPHLNPLYVLAGASLLLGGAVLYLAITVRDLKALVRRLSIDKGRVIDRKLIDLWKLRLRQHPPGTPKHSAYRKRLSEIGESGD